MDRVRQLADVPIFAGLEPQELARIAALAHEVSVAAGGTFFNETDQATDFFVLTAGRVRLTQVTPEGHHVVLRLIAAGRAFGGSGAFGESTYPVTAEAIEPSAALAWSSERMRQVLETAPRVAINALHVVSSRLYDLQQQHRQLMTERVERRVARALLRLAHDAGRRVEKGVEIDFPVSRQDVADMTGTTLYTVSRLLSGWEERGFVRGGRQRIVIVDANALIAIAEDLPRR